ncbi:phosphoribosyltransferase [Saccharothrix longispora]|uniref:phosphoribosyltransferase n=1 Tax=Saccharothrix longispora TaxID=33920 RepID=UPI0028FD7B21|nr:phosphoribosyltransferase [Saccharothrix longispora]MDU0292752.1 phosphoribosyltransferase [Saccharothrix longispora]
MGPHSRILDAYTNVLLPPPPAGTGICEGCADVVVPISIAVSGEQLARELGEYKYNRVVAVRKKYSDGLLTVLAHFLRTHEGCLAADVGTDRFDLVTIVPGSKLTAEAHPLGAMLGRRLGQTARRFAHALTATGPNTREVRPRSFHVVRDIDAQAVLLVDDTWTTGASLQSSAAALKGAGARAVAGLVIGRRVDADDPSARRVLAHARSEVFDWGACVLCRTA